MPPHDLAPDRLPREAARAAAAQEVLQLTQLAINAPTLDQGVTPTLAFLVDHTAAQGAAFFQLMGTTGRGYHLRATWGQVAQTPAMNDLTARGLAADTALIQLLDASLSPVFFDDIMSFCETNDFPQLGVTSLAASPVRARDGELLGAFLMYTFAPHTWTNEEAAIFSLVTGTIAGLAGRLAADEQTSAAHEAALRAMGLVQEVRDGETRGHTDRVTALAMALAQALCWSPSQIQALRWGAYLHDIGKTTIPDAVLLKPGPLTTEEWAVMRSHVGEGLRFAQTLGFLPGTALDVVADHHERWDGRGYPVGKSGTAISLAGRLFALCDVYDALTSVRPYKAAWTHEAALEEIKAQAGGHFDPELTRLFLRVMEDGRTTAS